METMKLLYDGLPAKVFKGEGGAYDAWNSNIFPLLGEAKVGGGKLTLQSNGFALPHYADCSKIGYVLQGTCGVAGIICPNSLEEKVVKLSKGNAITVPAGKVSWWFNSGDDEFQIIFLGETLQALQPGQFTYCFLTGALGVLKGFSTKSICKAYNLDQEQANKLLNSQSEALIIKLDKDQSMPKPSKNYTCFNFEEESPEIRVENGGCFTSFVAKEVELTCNMLKLDPNAMFGPLCAGDSGVQLAYVVKGSGRVEVVGMDGKAALDSNIEVGQVFVVPKFYVVSISAGGEGLECITVVTTSEYVFGQLSGKRSFWRAMSPQVLQASLNVDSKFGEFFMENLDKTSIIMPPQ